MYSFEEHTADVKIVAEGRSFKEALQNLADAVISLLNENIKEDKRIIKKEFFFEAKFREDMVVGLLEDIIYNLEVERIVPEKVEIKDVDVDKMKIGYVVIGQRGVMENIIKAATFYKLSIKKELDKWRIEVVLDV